MSNKKDIQEMLLSMGFPSSYIGRAFKVYEKNYGHDYNVEVLTELIIRLQNKDKVKKQNKHKLKGFGIGDKVIYENQMAEIVDRLSCDKIQITYPTNINVKRRKKCIVSPQQLKVLVIFVFVTIYVYI